VKALLDEQLSNEIAELLRSRGHDVVAVTERDDLLQVSDERLLDAAHQEERAVITNNIKDFRPIAANRTLSGQGHGGLILLPSKRSRSRAAIGALADSIESILNAHPKGIANREEWVPPVL